MGSLHVRTMNQRRAEGGEKQFHCVFLANKITPLCYHHFMSPRRACNFVNLLGLGLCEKEILFRLYYATDYRRLMKPFFDGIQNFWAQADKLG